MSAALYLIRKGGVYYRPNSQGYTISASEAGRYTLEEAVAITHPNGFGGSRDGMDYVPAPATEKAAPIPAEVMDALDALETAGMARSMAVVRRFLADRASQEERIREDERAKVETDAYDWLWAAADEWDREDIQDWIVKVCGTRMSPADRARLRGGAS